MLARISHDELADLFRGYGYTPYFVEGDDPAWLHQEMAATLDHVMTDIRNLQNDTRSNGFIRRPAWPMIVLRTPKGWSGPKEVDGKKTEGSWRSHQVPLAKLAEDPAHLQVLEAWLKSYRPQELFDDAGRLVAELADLAPYGQRRMSANPHANGGLLLHDLKVPDFRPLTFHRRAPWSARPLVSPALSFGT